MRFQQDDETRQGYISERAKQIAKFAPRSPLSPIPPVGGGSSPEGGGWWKAILGFVFIILLVGSCIGVMMNKEDAQAPMTPTRRPVTTSSDSSVRPTSTPHIRRQASPTATAINEEEHKLWLERQEHLDTVNDFMGMWNEMAANGVLDTIEAWELCFTRADWNQRLADAVDYVERYRELHPDFVADPLNTLLALEQMANESLAALANVHCPQ